MRELDIENDGGTVSLKGIGCMNNYLSKRILFLRILLVQVRK